MWNNKQYVSKVVESSTKFDIAVYTGTYNGVPQYAKYIIPKDVIKPEAMDIFVEFLKQRIEDAYIVTNK